VFDIGLLARRLGGVTGWLRAQPRAAGAAIGYFGASTGAAAALWAAAEPGADIAAVVSRGGRPDLAGPRLAAVTAPVMLIVGGRDEVVLDLNRRAQAELRCENDLAVVPATHLFQEPGTRAAAAGLARDWFLSTLRNSPAAREPIAPGRLRHRGDQHPAGYRFSGMPGIIGSTGWDRSSACTWDFSSAHSTTACSGGFRYSPTTS
jgi:hypothetical protein